jgi:hypothetical protein
LIFLFGICSGLALVYGFFGNSSNKPAYAHWSPTPDEILRAVGTESSGDYRDPRHQTFASLFQQRFRSHEMAIGLRFESNRRVRLMCAAMIPHTDMVRIAIDVHNEAQHIFQTSYSVDIYETYIVLPPVKCAVLNAPESGSAPTVTFLGVRQPAFHRAEERYYLSSP